MAARKVFAIEPISPELIKTLTATLVTIIETLTIEEIAKPSSFGSMAHPGLVSFAPPIVSIAMLVHELNLSVPSFIPGRMLRQLNPLHLRDIGNGFASQNRPLCAMQAYFSALYILRLCKTDKLTIPGQDQALTIEDGIWAARAECAITLDDLDWALTDLSRSLECNPSNNKARKLCEQTLERHRQQIENCAGPRSLFGKSAPDLMDTCVHQSDPIQRRAALANAFAYLPACATQSRAQEYCSALCSQLSLLTANQEFFKRFALDFYLSGALDYLLDTWCTMCISVQMETSPVAISSSFATSILWKRIVSFLPVPHTTLIGDRIATLGMGKQICDALVCQFQLETYRKTTFTLGMLDTLVRICPKQFLTHPLWVDRVLIASAAFVEHALCCRSWDTRAIYDIVDDEMQEESLLFQGELSLTEPPLIPFLSAEPLSPTLTSHLNWFKMWLTSVGAFLDRC
jgi:hypothetical protein